MATYDELRERAEAAEARVAELEASQAAGDETAKDAPASESESRSGDEIIAEAKAAHEAGDELTSLHVRALEHPEEFVGQDVPDPDTGEAPTS